VGTAQDHSLAGLCRNIKEVAISSIVVATIAAIVAVFSAIWTARTSQIVARRQELATQAIAELNNRFELQKRSLDKADRLEAVVAKYREPLSRTAFDLQSRLFNIVDQGFLWFYYKGNDRERGYVRENTVYVLCEYLGWVELLRREVEFLDLGDLERSRTLATLIGKVDATLASDRGDWSGEFRLFRGEQRAIGERMLTGSKTPEVTISRPMGYAAFVDQLSEPAFDKWVSALRSDVDTFAGNNKPNFGRLRQLQNDLIDVVRFLDDPPRRFSENQLSKLAVRNG
jgi:hypothetical protein